ncbi:MAG TPA: hypothetical protein IAB59_04460, partial [Candidatus Onthousia faecipullorum]|nr:hypothetical protein [Candidatus Onthousia faecipullorum]
IRAGTLDLVLGEGNELTLEKQIPIEDEEGMSLDGFTFSLTNNGNIESDYTIYLDDIALDEGESRIPDSSIRYSLTRNEEVFMTRNMTTMGSNPNRRVDFGTIGVDETINYTLRIWIDYDATKEEASGKTFKGKLRVVATQPVGEEVSTVLLDNIPKENQYDDGIDTFITGEDPNNYIWYSGKLWRAVSINNTENTVKLVTQWNISAIPYNASGNPAFEGSYMESWLNDTTVDGFLGNLRDYENFIVIDSVWNATMDSNDLGNIERPNGTTTVTTPVGLLNIYEYQSSNNGGVYGYLNNGLDWWCITPYNSTNVRSITFIGAVNNGAPSAAFGIRPSINLKSNVKIVDGDGTVDNPYRLSGDNDTDLSGTLLNTRYSGEYITFGNDENNLYRIVSRETEGLTKITSAEPLKSSGAFKTMEFDSNNNANYSSTNTIGAFLNGEYLVSYVDSGYRNMIEDNTIWYLGTVRGYASYKLAKYTDETGNTLTSNITSATIGLLRMGELMAGQFDKYNNNTFYWTLTLYDFYVRSVNTNGASTGTSPVLAGVKPSINLKSNVVITGGDGTKENPFTLELAD